MRSAKAVVLFVSVCLLMPVWALADPGWISRGRPFDEAASDPIILSVDSVFYAITDGAYPYKLKLYRWEGDTWRTVCDSLHMPWRIAAAACSWRGGIVIGGGDSGAVWRNDVYRIELNGFCRLLTRAASWPGKRGHHFVSTENAIMLLGGMVGDDAYSSTDSGKNWCLLPSAPWGPQLCDFGCIPMGGDSAAIFGGFEGYPESRLPQNDAWITTDAGHSWDSLRQPARLPLLGSFGMAVDYSSRRLWAVGGRDTFSSRRGFKDEVWECNIGEWSWQRLSLSPGFCSRINPGVFSDNGRLQVVCGIDSCGTGLCDQWVTEVAAVVRESSGTIQRSGITITPSIIRTSARIRMSPQPSPTELQIYNSVGRLVYTTSIPSSTTTFLWQRLDLTSGTYFFCIGHERIHVLLI